MNATLIEIREALEASWCLDTTYSPESYADRDPAWGQCAVTAVVVQDLLGGDLLRGKTIGPVRTRHYWNLIGGIDVDLTWRQFPVGTTLKDVEAVARKQLLANKRTRERYEILKSACEARL